MWRPGRTPKTPFGSGIKYIGVGLVATWLAFHMWSWSVPHPVSKIAVPSNALQALSRSYSDRLVLLVIPLPPFQWGLTRENLDSWRNPAFFPCQIGGVSRVDLLLLVSTDPDGALRREALALVEEAEWRKCFDRVLFHDSKLTPEQDTYGEGTLIMFYSLFDPGFLGGQVKRYHYLFLMEPDARPIRPFWIEGMLEAVRGPFFWVKGSVPRYSTSPDDVHINGNAFYRLNDPTFSKFVRESKGAFKYYLSFDQSLHAHRRVLNPQETAHLFIATEYVVNNWRGYTYWTMEAALKELPDTFIIHGKQAVKAACLVINCTDSMYGSMSLFGG